MAQQDENIRRTRSGRPINGHYRTDSPQAPKTRRARSRSKSPVRKQPRKAKNPVNLPGPLSELTENMKDVPVKDLEVWVHRSSEDRQKEVNARKGYVTRPMNAFILYRSAYADRTKAWCSENNHQVVSKVCGASWALESEKIKNYYKSLYEIEKDNHAIAFPEYKFSPAKAQSKKKRKSEEMADDSDGDWAQSHSVRRRHREGRDASYPARSVPPVTVDHETYANRNDWIYQEPRAWQAPQYRMELESQYAPPPRLPYYEPAINHALTQEQLMQNLYNSALLGVPMGIYPELSQLRSNATTPAAAVDPNLPSSYGMTRPILQSTHAPYSMSYPELPPPSVQQYVPVIASQHHIEPIKQIPATYIEEPPRPQPLNHHSLAVQEEAIVSTDGDTARRDSWGVHLHHIPNLEHQGEFERFLSETHDSPVYHDPDLEEPLDTKHDTAGHYRALESGELEEGIGKVDGVHEQEE
jgi:hypothetical protein